MTRADAPSSDGGRTSHEFVDHTSEVTLRVRAPTLPELVAEATRGFGALVPDAMRGESDAEAREIRVPAPDIAAGIVEWLNEMAYRCEADLWLPTEVDEVVEVQGELRIRARGISLAAPFVQVKAATLHNAVVRRSRDGLEAEVTLDI